MSTRSAHEHEPSAEEQLAILNAVSEVASRATAIGPALDEALGLVCDLLGLRTGWVYLLEDGTSEPSLSAARNLPPVFEEQPERWEGLCWCVHSLLTGDVKGAANVNVVSCSRLWQVEESNPERLHHHASIPFESGGRKVGIMNVAREDWRALSPAELRLLTNIGKQLGMTVDRLRHLAARTTDAVSDERERLARDLHDTLLQGLTGVGLQLETADALIDRDPEAARARLRGALAMTQTTVAETRAAIENLGPIALRQRSLRAALLDLAEAFSAGSGIQVTASIPPLDPAPPPAIAGGVYRVVQEGLHNVVKHSGASRVTVRLRQKGDRLSLILEDDGRGFDHRTASSEPHGYGLHSMRRRVALLGGRFRLRTAPGQGTRVEASIPLES